jgi:DNA-binding beta-propeller fold protein YncE
MGTDSLYLLDLRTGLVAARFASHGSAPARIGYSTQNHQVIITNSESNSVSMYDMESMKLTRSVATPPASPKGLVVSDNGTTAFVSLMDSNEVIRVDIPSGKITGRAIVGSGPERAAWVPRRHD